MINPNLSVVEPGRLRPTRNPLSRLSGPRGATGDLRAPRPARPALRSTSLGLGGARPL